MVYYFQQMVLTDPLAPGKYTHKISEKAITMPQTITHQQFLDAMQLVDDACDAGNVNRPCENMVYSMLYRQIKALRLQNKALMQALTLTSDGRTIAINSSGRILSEVKPFDIEFFSENVEWVKEQLNEDGTLTARTRNGIKNIADPKVIWKKLSDRRPFIQPAHVTEALKSYGRR